MNAILNRTLVEMEVAPATKAMIRQLCRAWHQSEPVVIERLWKAWKRRHPEVVV